MGSIGICSLYYLTLRVEMEGKIWKGSQTLHSEWFFFFLIGVQGCLWCQSVITKVWFNCLYLWSLALNRIRSRKNVSHFFYSRKCLKVEVFFKHNNLMFVYVSKIKVWLPILEQLWFQSVKWSISCHIGKQGGCERTGCWPETAEMHRKGMISVSLDACIFSYIERH